MTPFLNADRLAEHRRRNMLQSLLLVAGMSLLVMVSSALIWSWPGAIAAGLFVVALALIGPRVPPETVMRLYNGQLIDGRRGGEQLLHLVEVLADRAELRRRPRLFLIPSTTLNAFATGSPSNAAIGVTDGMLRRLDLRQLAGVIAHEMSHIRNNDLRVMAMADALARFTQVLAYFGLLLGFMNLPLAVLGIERFSWLAILLLYLAPTLASLLQMGLSRTREYDADLEAVGLTGDPPGLASALGALERYHGRFWEDLMLPIPARRIPYPSLLRSHPDTADRIARLKELEKRPQTARPIRAGDEPFAAFVGHGNDMAPRHRAFGFWY